MYDLITTLDMETASRLLESASPSYLVFAASIIKW